MLASRLRRVSGRAFSSSKPTVDATLDADEQRIRVAGVTVPASDGLGFAFLHHDPDPWTLPALIVAEPLSLAVGALLSVAVEWGGAVLFAGPRGAGKTTMLGALLWELPADSRAVVVEDTPELSIDTLQVLGRDVEPLWTDPGDGLLI